MTDYKFAAGLCARCEYSRRVGNRRGSVFWICTRAEADPRFARYPPLPVRFCEGFEMSPAGDSGEDR